MLRPVCRPNAADLKLRMGQGITGWVARKGTTSPGRRRQAGSALRHDARRCPLRTGRAFGGNGHGSRRCSMSTPAAKMRSAKRTRSLLEELAVQAAKVIHNTWLYEQSRLKSPAPGNARQRQPDNQTPPSTSTRPCKSSPAKPAALMEARMCSLLLLDETGHWLDLRASSGAGGAYLKKPRLNVGGKFPGGRRPAPKSRCNLRTFKPPPFTRISRLPGAKVWFRC